RAITEALTTHGRRHGWANAHPYLLRALPIHAAHAGILDKLLTDDAYLLHADLPRLLSVADQTTTRPGQDRTRLLRLTPPAANAHPPHRAHPPRAPAAPEHPPPVDPSGPPIRYHGRWAATNPRAEYAILHGHTDWVTAVCAVPVGGRTLLASASTDAT